MKYKSPCRCDITVLLCAWRIGRKPLSQRSSIESNSVFQFCIPSTGMLLTGVKETSNVGWEKKSLARKEGKDIARVRESNFEFMHSPGVRIMWVVALSLPCFSSLHTLPRSKELPSHDLMRQSTPPPPPPPSSLLSLSESIVVALNFEFGNVVFSIPPYFFSFSSLCDNRHRLNMWVRFFPW